LEISQRALLLEYFLSCQAEIVILLILHGGIWDRFTVLLRVG